MRTLATYDHGIETTYLTVELPVLSLFNFPGNLHLSNYYKQTMKQVSTIKYNENDRHQSQDNQNGFYLQYLLNQTPMLRKLSKSDCGLQQKKNSDRI